MTGPAPWAQPSRHHGGVVIFGAEGPRRHVQTQLDTVAKVMNYVTMLALVGMLVTAALTLVTALSIDYVFAFFGLWIFAVAVKVPIAYYAHRRDKA